MELGRINMLGVLASTDDVYRGDPVFINSQSSLQYHVKRISEAPQADATELPSIFTAYLDSLSGGYELKDDMTKESTQRIKEFTETFEDYMFIFRGKTEAYYNTYKLQKDTVVVRRTQARGEYASRYVTIPVFQLPEDTTEWERTQRVVLKRDYQNYEDFVERLKSSNGVGIVDGFQGVMETPFVIWYDKEQMEYYALGGFEKCVTDGRGYHFISDFVGRIVLTDDLVAGIIYHQEFNPTLLYMEESCYSDLYNRFARHSVDDVLYEKPLPVADTQNPVVHTENNRSKELVEITAEKTDKSLMEFCKYYAHSRNLFYAYEDIANFHAAIKTRSLVILSGMSGTGKSRLVEVYARSLGLNPDATLIIPVRPSWNDDSDLLGYVDLNKMVYRPSETGFIDLLCKAEKNPDELYLVCFDEMNLARVEHYFSQFLSLLEKPIGAERKLRIYSDSLKGLYNSADYPSEITIGDNIIFVGTVNIDESTYHFSDKVLDRSNVIRLRILDYSSEWKKPNYANIQSPKWTKEEFIGLIKETDETDYLEHRKCLWAIHKKLQEINESMGIGPRIVKQIERYLCNYPKLIDSQVAENDSFDIQLVQRVLTKIRGSEDKLRALFDVDAGYCSILDSIFDEYSFLSTFDKSRSVLARKKEELKIYGYCI